MVVQCVSALGGYCCPIIRASSSSSSCGEGSGLGTAGEGGLLVKTEWESWTDGNDIPKVEKSLVGEMRKQHQKATG